MALAGGVHVVWVGKVVCVVRVGEVCVCGCVLRDTHPDLETEVPRETTTEGIPLKCTNSLVTVPMC